MFGERRRVGLMDRLGFGRSPAGEHRVRIRRHDEQVGIQFAGKQLGAEVLVDHGLHADELAVRARLVHRWYAAAAGAYHDRPVVKQPFDRAYLEDPLGSGDGTTRRHLAPSCLNVQPFSALMRSASALS